ncbi:MAG: 16S rRNA processing protein RimM [Bacteroidetes bacterium]|nr:16S rRNA processing protein RimM [Bacteroidota bacterium]
MALRYIGTILRTHGTDGSFFVGEASPKLELRIGCKIRIGYSGQFASEYTLKTLRASHRGVIISVEGIINPESAAILKEEGVFVDESLLQSGNVEEYYIEEILGCLVIDHTSGKSIGIINDVWLMPANDVWVVSTPKGDVPLPVIDDVIKKVDLTNKKIEVTVLDGLMELAGGDDAIDKN